ncbi:putative RNA interference and gene silencing protein [Decorospora gaudefroyi]|uniref:Putative RNA interference and gene silencing protein n=1 Tax=Decorospora gaudefroyi TaxID=184978 RepID=A0A6A5K3H1_9PLEO|nr:putative RNA interference and gene silencing protein [Decorospora gaudefroyi]
MSNQYQGGRGGGGFRGDRGGGGGRGGGPQPVQVFPNGQALDPKVAHVEDTIHPLNKNALAVSGLKLTEGYPTRPGYGTKGAKVVLTANYVELLPPSNMVLHRYDLSVSPEVVGKKLRRVIQLLLQSEELAPYRAGLATDFRSTLISKTKFKNDHDIIEVLYLKEGHDEAGERPNVYKVRVQYTKTLTLSELINWMNSTSLDQSYPDKHELTQALNIFLNHYAKSSNHISAIGSNKSFSLNANAVGGDLGSGLQVIRGFFSSVRVATARILVNIQVSHGAFYRPGPLPMLMEAYGTGSTTALDKFLKNVRIQPTHLKEIKNKAGQVITRVSQIVGLAKKNDGHGLAHPPRVNKHGAGPRDVEFWLADKKADKKADPEASKPEAKENTNPTPTPKGKGKGKAKAADSPKATDSPGKYITVFDFFKIHHNIVLKRPDLPVVNCGNGDHPMYLPPEVCKVLAGQASTAKLDGAQTQQMIRHAVRRPWENAASIVNEGIATVGLDENANVLLRSFDLKFKQGLIKVPGRVLNGPKVMYKGGKTANPLFGSWNMIKIQFNAPGRLVKWSWLMLSLDRKPYPMDMQTITTIMKEFHQGLLTIGIAADPPLPGQQLYLQSAHSPELEARLKAAADKLDLLFIVLPENNIPLYKRIKTLSDKQLGLHTVCSVGSKLAKENRRDQYIANVALKFNLKLGGTNQIVDTRNLGIIDQNKTMVVGIDVTHPSPGSASNAPSVSAMVASIDKLLGQWPAVLRVQQGKKEEVDHLGEMLKSRLNLWKTKGKHQAFPENILVYRDGVSEGQYNMVLDNELPRMRKACEAMYPATDTKKGLPRFTIVVCGKRHKTRFYPTTEKDCDRSGNTQPGTVVDRGVTEARNWDFFLQAHAALQGTARPCHYYIVHDEIFRQIYGRAIPPQFQNIADIVEDLTHNMCYLFGRATKAVSLCPPAYYADLACERARCYLSNLFDTPSPSTAPSVAGASAAGEEAGGDPTDADVAIHPRLRDTMFYI